MSTINLSKAVRSNLLSLQSTAASMAKTQERLATGLKVNSALDNPSNFFTAASLNSRAGDMSNLLDSMSNGIKTIEAADNGLSSITKTVESMQSTLRQARQDKSFKTQSFTIDPSVAFGDKLSISGGAVGTTAVDVDLANGGVAVSTSPMPVAAGDPLSSVGFWNGDVITVSDGTESHVFNVTNAGGQTFQNLIDGINGEANLDITASIEGGHFTLKGDNPAVNVDVSGLWAQGVFPDATPPATSPKSVDDLVSAINANTSLAGKVRASNDSGKLRIENLSTEDLTIAGLGTDGEVDGGAGTATIGGNDVRKNLVKQFNDLRDQLDKLADDSSFNGINLLRGDKLKLTFNETGTSTIDIQAKDADGNATSIDNLTLGITNALNAEFDSDDDIDARLSTLSDVMGQLRSHASSFGSNLSIVQNRQDFTKNMINTLETGAANLTLADTNEEAANLLALQTRQQLSSTALSMASQADQAVLRLF